MTTIFSPGRFFFRISARRSSSSMAMTQPALLASSAVMMPSPGPTSMTVSAGGKSAGGQDCFQRLLIDEEVLPQPLFRPDAIAAQELFRPVQQRCGIFPGQVFIHDEN